MRGHRAKAVLFLLGGVLALGLLGLASMAGPGSSEAQQDTMHNCPQAGKWAISVWSGDDDTDTGQALNTCGAGAVDAAYYIDPTTNSWQSYFLALPQITTLPTLDNMQGVIAHGAAGPPTATPTPTLTPTPTPTAMPAGIWTGVWDTSYVNLKLTQTDSSVTGTYVQGQGKIEGTVQGDKLIGTWSEPPSYAPPDEAGDFEFTMSPDGNSFLGRWRYGSSGPWEGEWTGTRIELATAKEAYPLALDAARAKHPDAYLDRLDSGCNSSTYVGAWCFEWDWDDMAAGDGRSDSWDFWFYSPAARETFVIRVARGQASEGSDFQESDAPDSLPLEEMIDSTDAVQIADAHEGSAYKAATPGGQLCGAKLDSYDLRWQIDYCPPFEQGGTGLAVSMDGRTGEVESTSHPHWGEAG